MIPRAKNGKGVTGAVRYAFSEGKDSTTGQYRTEPKGERSRVLWFGGTGFGFEIETTEDADLARRIMEFAALNQTSRTRQCEQDCVHLSLGWRPGEEPTRAQMEEAAHQALAALGMGNARALFVAHGDEPYAHLHIVASKINPDTGRAYDLKGNWLKLSRWAEKYERDFSHGIVCTRREENNQMREAISRRDAGAVLELMTQQRATFKGRDLERVLAKQISGELERAQFAEKVLTHADAVKLAEEAQGRTSRYTSRAVLEAEGQVLRAAAGLSRADQHELSQAVRQVILRFPEFDSISREQAAALRHATGATGLALIDGQAGTGKSFVISAIRQAYTVAGYHVIGLAPTNAVAEDMRANGFDHAATIHSELFRLNSNRTAWHDRTLIILDEAAMIDTKLMAQLAGHAHQAGAKLIMVGDDRQLSSIDRGGMFGVLKDQHGAAELAQVRRQNKNDDKRAAELMAEGNFHSALAMYDSKGAIHWTHNQEAAREALVAQWAKDSAADPAKSRFVFAYTNADVDRLNADIRTVRKERGELGSEDHAFQTKHGRADFAEHDRIQITGTDKGRGLVNGAAGTIESIDGSKIVLQLDGRAGKTVEFDAQEFQDFRHGYAGTIYKGQGRTLDQTYLYHSEQWRSAASYVALTRHRDKAELFVARDTAEDVKQLSRQMARVDDRRAASHFHRQDAPEPVRPLTPQELPKIELPAKAPEPQQSRPLNWAQSPGMAAQQSSALKAARNAERPAAPQPIAEKLEIPERAPSKPQPDHTAKQPDTRPPAPLAEKVEIPERATKQQEISPPAPQRGNASVSARFGTPFTPQFTIQPEAEKGHQPTPAKPVAREPAPSASNAPRPTPTPSVAKSSSPPANRSLARSAERPAAPQPIAEPAKIASLLEKLAAAEKLEIPQRAPSKPQPDRTAKQPDTRPPAPLAEKVAIPERATKQLEISPPAPQRGNASVSARFGTPFTPQFTIQPEAEKGHQPTPAKPVAREPAPSASNAPRPTPMPSAAKSSPPPANRPLTANEIQARHGNPTLQARYQQQEQRREDQQKSAAPAPGKPAAGGNVPSEKRAEMTAAEEKRFKELTSRFTRDNDRAHQRENEKGNDRSGGRGGRGRTRR